MAKSSKSTGASSTRKSTAKSAPEKASEKAPDAPAQSAAPKTDAPKTDVVKPAAAKSPSTAQTPPKDQPVKTQMPKLGASKTDVPKPDAAKSEPSKSEPAKAASAAKPTASAAAQTAKPAEPEKPKDPVKPAEVKPAEPAAKPTPKPAPSPQAAPEKPRSVFFPMLLGGVIAGGIGYLAADYHLLTGNDDLTALQSQLAAQQTTLQDQAQRIENLNTAAPDTSADLAPITEALSALESRIADLETRPAAADPSGEAGDYAAELAALKQSVEQQQSEIEGLLGNARSVEEATKQAAQASAAQAALAKLRSAIDAGQPFEAEVQTLQDTLPNALPDALAAQSAQGVPTLASLQSGYPDAARAALGAARTTGEDGEPEGFSGFLRRQLGARSVAPREGNDPDAILSRAEQAVKEGRLADALAETNALPEASKAAMGDWLAGAQARADALQAADELGNSLSAE
ncbi:MAG: mitofilin family membrane protein [Sulfitobacter sp.]